MNAQTHCEHILLSKAAHLAAFVLAVRHTSPWDVCFNGFHTYVSKGFHSYLRFLKALKKFKRWENGSVSLVK